MRAATGNTESQGERAYRRFLTAFWVLIRTAGSGAADGAVEVAAATCAGALQATLVGESHFVLQERAGALFANGARMRPGVDTFAAIAGITDLMNGAGIGELLWMPPARPEELFALARCWHEVATASELESALQRRGCGSVFIGPSEGAVAPPQVAAATAGPVAASGSQLGVVYSLQRFATDLALHGPLGGRRARAALQVVLHALLRSADGLQPLARLLEDRAARTTAVRASVLAVRTAEELGWSTLRGTAAGMEAMLGAESQADGDAEVAQLAAASRSVAASLVGDVEPEEIVAQLQAAGRVPGDVALAMTQALAVG